MPINRISSNLSVTDQHEVMDLIAQINQKLAFLIDVGPQERRSMTKLGDRNRAFTLVMLAVRCYNNLLVCRLVLQNNRIIYLISRN